MTMRDVTGPDWWESGGFAGNDAYWDGINKVVDGSGEAYADVDFSPLPVLHGDPFHTISVTLDLPYSDLDRELFLGVMVAGSPPNITLVDTFVSGGFSGPQILTLELGEENAITLGQNVSIGCGVLVHEGGAM
jgi:hypothetical protein